MTAHLCVISKHSWTSRWQEFLLATQR